MISEIPKLILETAANSFLDITVFVGAALMVFGYLNYKKRGGLLAKIKEKKKLQPILGALLGLTPGCGGAILVMPLYIKRSVTFGTVIAALTATAGDAAFVLISTMPMDFLKIASITFVVGVISGYIIDFFKIGERKPASQVAKENLHCQTCCHAQKIQHIGHEEGDQVDIALHHKTKHREQPNTLGYKLTHRGYMFYWIFILTGLVIGIARLAGLPLATSPIMYLGITGTILSITLMLASKKYLADDTHEEAELKLMSLKETLVHTAEETAFVGVWVFVSYVFFGILSYFLDSGIQTALLAGIIPVLIGAAIGIIPGCGPQIVFVSLYSKGLLPFAALVAHSISQDGDALFPLIAMDKKAALQATVITTATALVVGVAFYLLF